MDSWPNCRALEAVGRLVIDLDQVLANAPGGEQDIVLKNGDRLLVPKQSQEVTVIGEVQNRDVASLHHRSVARRTIVDMSGGVTNQADEDRIYVVRANGSVDRRFRWCVVQ